jgi:hypothetical protein
LIWYSSNDVRATLQERVPTSFETSFTMFTPTTKAIATHLNIASDETAKTPINRDL